MMNFLVSYDISSNKKRTKIAKILDDYGDRVQKSVFELPGLDELLWNKCLKRLKKVKLEENETIRIYELCEKCRKDAMVLGEGEVSFDEPEIYIV